MLERGSRSIAVIFRAIAFTAIPTLLELAAVCTILARTFDARVSALVLTTFAAYAGWTIAIARVRAAGGSTRLIVGGWGGQVEGCCMVGTCNDDFSQHSEEKTECDE